MTSTTTATTHLDTADPPDEPLRIVEVVPPDSPDGHLYRNPDGTYTVLLRLTRIATPTERHETVRLGGDDIRLFGSTMTLSNTTLEEVARTTGALSALIAEVERSAAASDSGDAASYARTLALEEAEVSRRTDLARSISFDGGSAAKGDGSPPAG